MWYAANQFEHAAQHAAAERLKRAARERLLKAVGHEEEEEDDRPPRPAPRFDEQLRLFFYANVIPLVVWIIRVCLLVLVVSIASVGTYTLLWGVIMRGLDVRSRPIFFDYAPGGATMPAGVVDLRSTTSAPWTRSCGGPSDNSYSVGDVCIRNNEDAESDAPKDANKNAILASGQRYFFEVSLTLPESEVNKQLGVFMINVELRSGDGSLLASSKQHSMLPYESTLVSTFRKAMLILPLASGLLSETREITLLCFDNYVDADAKQSLALVELSIGVPNPASFPDTRQAIQIHSATLRYGREMNALQSFLRNWWYTCAFFGISFLFLGYSLLVLSILNYQTKHNARNTQPYADFFDSDDDASAQHSGATSDRWMGADIEILEDDDEEDSNAWEPIHANNETGSQPKVTANDNPTRNSARDNLVSDDEASSSRPNGLPKADARGRKKTNGTAFPLGTLAKDEAVKGHEPLFASPKPKPATEKDSKRSGSSGGKAAKSTEQEDKTAQLKEEIRLADMVMKGQSKYGSFTDE